MRIDSALFCNVIRILSLLLTFLLFGCQSASHDVRQIGREALMEAYIQLDSSNKTEAMRLFKEAEHYGLLADDTLTVAHARYNIALNLGYHADKEQTVSLLKAAVKGFGDDYVYCAKALMTLGDFYQFRHLRNTVLIAALVTLIISLIGLIGYVGNEMQSRRKEVAIRKVCGATLMEVLQILSMRLTYVVLPAVMMGIGN